MSLPLAPVNDKLHKTRAGLMPSTGYNVDRAFFRLAMQETLIIIREYNAFLLYFAGCRNCSPARSCARARACTRAHTPSRLWNRVERYRPRRALINDDGQIDDFLRGTARSFLLAIFSNAGF